LFSIFENIYCLCSHGILIFGYFTPSSEDKFSITSLSLLWIICEFTSLISVVVRTSTLPTYRCSCPYLWDLQIYYFTWQKKNP
jgi:hypothetical protein